MRKSTTLFTGTPPPRVLSRAKIIQSTSLKGMWTGIILYPSIYAEIFQVMLSFIFTHQNSVCIFFFLINATCPIPFNLLHAIRPSLKYWIRRTKCVASRYALLSRLICLLLLRYKYLFYNCPTRCDLFSLLHFCRQVYMFRVLTLIIRSSYNCNYSFWYWLTGSTTIRSRCWVGTDSCVSYDTHESVPT